MLPPFDDDGYLPSGIHLCSMDDVIARFGIGSEEREAQTHELLQFIRVARDSGVRRVLINGSFVTGKLAPNDVDIVFLPGPDYPRGGRSLLDDRYLWPFLQIIEAADDPDFDEWGTVTFATDRGDRSKGVVEVLL